MAHQLHSNADSFFARPSDAVGSCFLDILSELAFGQREELKSVALTEVWYHALFVNCSPFQTFQSLTLFASSGCRELQHPVK